MEINLAVLARQFQLYQAEYEAVALRALRSGWYILGTELENFEREFAEYLGAKFCIGVNSGLDALTLAIRALGIGAGDEVIVPANTYIATALAVIANGAAPVFVEPDEFYNLDAEKISAAVTEKTRAIMVVHLYGHPANLEKICAIARKFNLPIVEDCAQSHGARFCGKMTGTFGVGCFSFYPTKNLGAFGDAGAVVTDDENFAREIRTLRNYGSEVKYHNKIAGVNSRLDEIQAALLRVKLSHLDELNAERKKIARRYLNEIKNRRIILPKILDGAEHVWHQFVVRTDNRAAFQKYLAQENIQTVIHYPIPPHLAECYAPLGFKRGDFPIAEKFADEVLSLPMFNGMTQAEIDYVIEVVNKF
ncbi:MAG: DegT/DnrJ/EryC1/StrS family aminotransferase [Selenomonadaceae bacterium]|nr:DegT/DnrJ/EryC1/StrS family aminotransferase [Selenomonadaceae bacterium]